MAGRFSSVALAAAASLLPWAAAQGEFPWGFPVNGSTVCAGGRIWDGFGVNYVEAAQTRNYSAWKQDYGGFSILQDADKQAIMELLFGSQGLQIPLVKSFLDVWHEGQSIGDNDNADPYTIYMAGYDHVTTTSNMRYFLSAAKNLSALTSTPLAIIVGLYGPQPWTTAQGFVRGRDIQSDMLPEVAEYIVSFAKYLLTEEGLPVVAVSPFNEGEDYTRWPANGTTDGGDADDYNAWWTADLLKAYMELMPGMLAAQGVPDLLITPGETTSWFRQLHLGYSHMLASNTSAGSALDALGLLTSHGFVVNGAFGQWWSTYTSGAVDLVRAAKAGMAAGKTVGGAGAERTADESPVGGPQETKELVQGWRRETLGRLTAGPLHAWVTSTGWLDGGINLAYDLANQIQLTGINAIIPWAAIHRPSQWIGGDPNGQSLIRVNDDATWDVLQAYYTYKHFSLAGGPGTTLCSSYVQDPLVQLLMFSDGGVRGNMIIINAAPGSRTVQVSTPEMSPSAVWQGYATVFLSAANPTGMNYTAIGQYQSHAGVLQYIAPAVSITTFFGQ